MLESSWIQFGIFAKRLLRVIVSSTKLALYTVLRRTPKVLLMTTDDLVIVKGNYFRLVWDIENCSKVKIEGYGTYSPKGQLILKADFEQITFKCWIHGYPRKFLRTISVKTISVTQKASFRLDIATPNVNDVQRKTVPSYIRVVPKLHPAKPTLNYRSQPKFLESELNKEMAKLSINLKTLTHYET